MIALLLKYTSQIATTTVARPLHVFAMSSPFLTGCRFVPGNELGGCAGVE